MAQANERWTLLSNFSRLRFCYIPGRKEETLGRLVVELWNGARAAGKGKRA